MSFAPRPVPKWHIGFAKRSVTEGFRGRYALRPWGSAEGAPLIRYAEDIGLLAESIELLGTMGHFKAGSYFNIRRPCRSSRDGNGNFFALGCMHACRKSTHPTYSTSPIRKDPRRMLSQNFVHETRRGDLFPLSLSRLHPPDPPKASVIVRQAP